jgi:hypothetical protein
MRLLILAHPPLYLPECHTGFRESMSHFLHVPLPAGSEARRRTRPSQ